MSEPVYIACVLVSEARDVYAGSVPRSCADCRRAVWASPASMEATRTMGAVLVCLSCAAARTEADGGARIGALPSTLREVRSWLRRRA